MSLTIATWNVNSIKARLAHLVRWLRDTSPDIVLLQETKTVDEGFPHEDLSALGYNIAVAGQKTYNGVAILSKTPIDVLTTSLAGDPEDLQARYIEGFTGGIRVASIYAPNGNPVDTDKFVYKLSWLRRLVSQTRSALESGDAFVFGGDFNVAPNDLDVYNPQGWKDDALCRPESRAALRALMYLGLTDAVRANNSSDPCYTWWDYRGGAWQNDKGLRIDHLLMSPEAADRHLESGIDRTPRGWERTSDHTPVWCRVSV
jgi:exodeoxyribonuclease-3